MEKRTLGNTGLEVSCLGFGGFHLLEIPADSACKLLNAYLDKGGNYIETAQDYGNGEAERKIGLVMKDRRDECILVTKTGKRDAKSLLEKIESSFANLQTDYIDILLMHAVSTIDELNKILAPDGAFAAAQMLKAQNRIGHIGISMHGQPDVLIEALNRAPFELVMTTLNYYDVNNFPKLLGELVPLAHKKNAGIILMKPLGDGLLHKNVDTAFRYALSLDTSVVVTGMNTMEMLEKDIEIANTYIKLSDEEMRNIENNAEELGDYVCRQCGQCSGICPEGIDFEHIYRLEGMYDRQLRTGKLDDIGEFGLRDKLRFWFGTEKRAVAEYADIKPQGNVCTNCVACSEICPYHIDIAFKTKLADYKLGERDIY
ncbi:MAG: aldo/keto reductase [Clostridia bacterium]|nr:aldo/keto reductase [Clostridia bacterium]